MEFIVTNLILMLNVYVIGFIIFLVISVFLSGLNEDERSNFVSTAVLDSLKWPFIVIYLLGTVMSNFITKDNNGKQ